MGLKQSKPVVTNLFLFIIASILFLFSITDLIISKKIKKTVDPFHRNYCHWYFYY